MNILAAIRKIFKREKREPEYPIRYNHDGIPYNHSDELKYNKKNKRKPLL